MPEVCDDCGQVLSDLGRWRVTLRADDIELQGIVANLDRVRELAKVVDPIGVIVIASPLSEEAHAHETA